MSHVEVSILSLGQVRNIYATGRSGMTLERLGSMENAKKHKPGRLYIEAIHGKEILTFKEA